MKLKKILTNTLLVLLFAVGLVLVFNNQIKNFFIQQTSDTYTISRVSKKEIKENQKKPASFDFGQVNSISSEAVAKAKAKNTKVPTVEGIAVPDVGINLSIFRGLDNDSLLFGAGTMKEDQQLGQGNYALAGHKTENPELLFTPLERSTIGQLVYITDLENIYTYTITKNEIVDPTAVEIIEDVPDKTLLTLVLCGDMAATTRRIVQAEYVNKIPMNTASEEQLQAFQLEKKTF